MERPKSREPKYVAILALASSLILIVGWFARPREIPQNPPPIPTETELEQLSRRAERRSLESISKYFAGTARGVESSIVHIKSVQWSGIAWDEGHIITAPFQDRHASKLLTVAVAAGEADAKAAIWGPHLPLIALESPSALAAGLTPAHRATSLPQAGDWILAVWRTGREHVFAPGNFRQSVPVDCGVTPVQEVVSSLSFTRAMAGGGLFDMDGNLLAVILPCGERLTAVAAASIQSLVEKSNTIEQRVLGRYGLSMDTLAADESNYFKTKEGVIVREVWTGYPGDEAGLMPGDIVTALMSKPVVKPDDLRLLTAPSDQQAFELEVQRGSTKLKIALRDGGAEVSSDAKSAPGAGLVWESPAKTFRIDSVLSGSRAAKAGIEPGDRLVRIDLAEPRNLAQVQQIFAGSKAVFLEIDRGGRRIGIFVK